MMFWIESGKWNGRSYFGAVFLVPVLLFPTAKILKVRYGDLLDISAPAGCVMLALLKVKCFKDGCCYGRIFKLSSGPFWFPSQKVEGLAGVVLTVILLILIRRKKSRGVIYCWYLILYGSIRFVLNLFRETTPWIGPLPAGNFWSLVALVLGITVMIIVRERIGRGN